jgi:hypothetical protein
MAISASNEAGQFVSQSGMSPTCIVEAVDVSAKGRLCSSSGLEAGSPDQLVANFPVDFVAADQSDKR